MTAHRNTLRVADVGRKPVLDVLFGEIPAPEKTDDHLRACGGIGLIAYHRIEARDTGILFGPHSSVAGGCHLPGVDFSARCLAEEMLVAIRTRFHAGVLAKKSCPCRLWQALCGCL